MSAVERELHRRISELAPEEQERVLRFTRALGTCKRGGRRTPGAALLRFAGRIPKEDLRQIQQAIEEGREQVDTYGW